MIPSTTENHLNVSVFVQTRKNTFTVMHLCFIHYSSPYRCITRLLCFCRCKFCCISFSWRPSRRQTVRDRVSCFPQRSKGIIILIVSLKAVGEGSSEHVHPLGITDIGIHKSNSSWAKAGVLSSCHHWGALLNVKELDLLGAHLGYY